MITVKSFAFNPFSENTYVLYDQSKSAVIIDPGCYTAQEEQVLLDFIKANALRVEKVLLTHAHIDHILGLNFIEQTFNLKPYLHKLDLEVLMKMSPMAAQMYGIALKPCSEPEGFIQEGDLIQFGAASLEVLFTPGHAPGHVVFVSHEDKFVIGGDVLFQGSIGRTDFPNSNHQDLIDSIQKKLFMLGDDYVVYTGHGASTTIGEEKQSNPFVGQQAL